MLLFHLKKKNAVSFDSYSLDPGLPGHADKPTNAAEARLQGLLLLHLQVIPTLNNKFPENLSKNK